MLCTYPGGTADEGLVVIGSADDLLALRMHADEGERLGDFLARFASPEVANFALDEPDRISSTGIVPVDVAERIGDAIVRFEADEDLVMTLTHSGPGRISNW